MLQLTSLMGFAAQSQAADITPNPVTIADITAAGFIASALTGPILISGINMPITLRFQLSSPLGTTRTITLYRDSVQVAVGDSGTFLDIPVSNGQVLQAELANATDLTTWSGTVSLVNLSDAGAALASFAFSLQDTGSGSGGGGGGGGGLPP